MVNCPATDDHESVVAHSEVARYAAPRHGLQVDTHGIPTPVLIYQLSLGMTHRQPIGIALSTG